MMPLAGMSANPAASSFYPWKQSSSCPAFCGAGLFKGQG